MCSYDSTCDHLPLADLSPKEAPHPQFEAFVKSRKLNMDSISLGPPPPHPRRVRPPFHRLSGLSVHFLVGPFYGYLVQQETNIKPTLNQYSYVCWKKKKIIIRRKNNGFIFLEVGSPTDIFGYLYS